MKILGFGFRVINRILRIFGLQIIKKAKQQVGVNRLRKTLTYINLDDDISDYLKNTKSQFGQDWLVIKLLGDKIDEGFFVEFGVVDGIFNSNTFFLENQFGWKGIVGEPAKRWHQDLTRNRQCNIDTRCVYSDSGQKLMFGETGSWLGGNTLIGHQNDDGTERRFSNKYIVDTVSLNDLLHEHQAPKKIDFISVDTEGSEYEILKNLDFTKWSFDLLLVEHNYNNVKRISINKLLLNKGYFKLPLNEEISGVDDWYASKAVAKKFSILYCGTSAPNGQIETF